MEMTLVTSSNIAAMWYDLEKSELYIKFKNNKKFTYLGVTQEEYGRLINAESIGKHFNQFIKSAKVGREVVTAENDTAENDTTPMRNSVMRSSAMRNSVMSDKEKIKLLRDSLINLVETSHENEERLADRLYRDFEESDALVSSRQALEATRGGE